VRKLDKKDTYPTTAPEKKEITIENDSNIKNALKNSVNKHKKFEEANIEVTGDEIGQQNENL
jgi:hypothetical protein